MLSGLLLSVENWSWCHSYLDRDISVSIDRRTLSRIDHNRRVHFLDYYRTIKIFTRGNVLSIVHVRSQEPLLGMVVDFSLPLESLRQPTRERRLLELGFRNHPYRRDSKANQLELFIGLVVAVEFHVLAVEVLLYYTDLLRSYPPCRYGRRNLVVLTEIAHVSRPEDVRVLSIIMFS